jgi:DNA-nicking Smr family endonuclease
MIVLVAGVAGSGKSTVGSLLARQLGWEFEDGDDLHPAANIAKMRAGVPLTDEDRRPWLLAVAAWMDQVLAAGKSGVIACSALRRSYREDLRAGRPDLQIVFLQVSYDILAARQAWPFLPSATAQQPVGRRRTSPPPRTRDRGDRPRAASRRRDGGHPAAGPGFPRRNDRRWERAMKLKLDLHDVYNRGQDIDRALLAIINEAVAKKAPVVEIIPGKGSGQLKKRVLRFLEQKEIKALYHRVEKDSKNFGRLFVHFRW